MKKPEPAAESRTAPNVSVTLPDGKYLTVRQVAQYFNLPAATAYRLIAEGALPSIRFGERGVRVPVDGLIEYERTHVVQVKARGR